MPVSFLIKGKPVPKGRARATIIGGHARLYTPDTTRRFEELVALFGRSAMRTAGLKLLDEPLAFHLIARMPIPKSTPKYKRKDMLSGLILPAKKPDLDNLTKSVTDGLNGVVYRDDALICQASQSKIYHAEPGVFVSIQTIAEQRAAAERRAA
ncbi:RusA family crossover junction endodeoxyribonuclease [Maricaulis sp. MIT060901]|uniref:RusA family crossover junction endodeoxyribonuclease n=1 Tax=Maricaulis sp. MIT060901 TaxID=3096993 RepID=UPI00399B1351